MNEHKPVMVAEVLKGLHIQSDGIYLDATFGRGGHSRAILDELNSKGRLLAMDRDPTASLVATQFAKNDPRFVFHSGPFSSAYAFCESEGVVGKVNGILLDLGVSSPQLDDPSRGFSFTEEGPLDMRMDPRSGVSAAEWLNSSEESEIAEVLKVYGEERFHRRIAHAIIEARKNTPITSTKLLAEIVAKANPAWEKHKHPATRSFQAIRIFINQELAELDVCLEQSLNLLAVGGRLVVISFHSLEDRKVKHFMQLQEKGDSHPKGLPIKEDLMKKKLKRVGPAQKPSEKEIQENRRSRSAILRVGEKL